MLQRYRDNLTGIIHEVEIPDEPLVPIEIPDPAPTLDERVEKVEADVATTKEVLDALFGGV